MDIQIRFEDDGTTALLWSEQPCLDFVPRADASDIDVARHSTILRLRRGLRTRVWCFTGGRGEKEVLTGEWRLCRVETENQQIARLEAERDEKHNAYVLRDAHALLWKGYAREFWREAREIRRRLRRLRDAARGACDREMGEGYPYPYPENVKDSTLVAHLNTMHTPTRGDLINARARAGAARIEAEEAAARLKKDDKRRPEAMRRVVIARAEEACAREAEQAALEQG